ncbi:MAG: glycosyl hydrolase [Vicinamibacterales bacterium]
MRFSTLPLVIAVGLVATALTTTATAQPDAYGVVTHDLDELRANAMSELGAGFARISVRWWQIEPTAGDRQWNTLDDYVWNRAAPRNLQLYASLGAPPEWAGGGPDHNRRPANLDEWYDFVFATVSRYRTYIKHWGIWNEPNLTQFLENGADYRDIALTARRAITAADPSAIVLGPEVSEHAFDNGYFADVMSAWGRDTFDIVTVHVYSTSLASKMDTLVYPWTYGKPVWLTEVGRTARAGDAVTEELQRLYYQSALQTFEPRRWWWSKIFFYDIWAWNTTDLLFGLTHPDWSHTRAFDSYHDWILSQPVVTPTTDSDGDGMPDAFEGRMGLNPRSAAGADGAAGDPDGDGVANIDEFRRGSHPRAPSASTRYLAEGSTGAPFSTTFALLNTSLSGYARAVLRFLKDDGSTVSWTETVPKATRRTIDAASVVGQGVVAFSTIVESDTALVVDRTMRWGPNGGAHSETSVSAPATQWYLAEGATHSGFELFYLLENPGNQTATVRITYLRPAPLAPVERTYVVGPLSRQNIWVNQQGPELAATDVSASIVSDVPVIVERAMYRGHSGNGFVAGHESAGVTTAAPRWFFAEGATGTFFDLFILVANPSASEADINVTFLLPSGQTILRPLTVAPRSRVTLWVDQMDPLLADTAVSTIVESTNGVPVLAERAMWWPGPTATTWYEAHNSPGATTTGTKWAIAEGEVGGDRSAETYLLIANTSPRSAAARVTLYFENGTQVAKTFGIVASSRFNVNVAAEFPTSAGRRFGATIESLGSPPADLVVERATYESGGVRHWNAGTNALATKLP